MLYTFQAVSPPIIRNSKTVHTASGICQAWHIPDATLYNILYYCKCCTRFRRFLRPSSGAQKLYTQHRVYAKLGIYVMQRYTVFFITVNAVHFSGGFSAHHQELKNCTYSLLAATASGSSKQAWHIHDVVCTVFELLMVGAETA